MATKSDETTPKPKVDADQVVPSNTEDQVVPSNTEKDPADWVTGNEPMTGAQASYLKTLCEETGQDFDATLTKADASRRIDELKPLDKRLTNAGQQA